MGKAQKRARKKEFRDQRVAEYTARARRQRMGMFIAVTVALLGLIAVALGSGLVGGDEPTAAVACGGEDPPEADPQQYDAPPQDQLEPGVDYRAVVHTSCGDIEMDLLEEKSPATVGNFVFLASEGFYDGLRWHRVERNTVIQTGDPNGIANEEPNGPGYAIEDELPKRSSEYVYGVVGMANAGPGTAGSQWFIVTHKDGPAGYQPLYAIFATVDEASYETLEAIDKLPTTGGNDPATAVMPQKPIYIESIEIVES